MTLPSSPSLRVSLLTSVFALAACGPGTSPPDAAPTDALVTDAAPTDDVAPTDAPPADAPPTDAPSACEIPAVRLADSAEARALFDAPARCGQPAYRIITDARLGQPATLGVRQQYTATVLRALAAGAGVMLPAPITYDVAVDQLAYTTQDRGQLVNATTLVAYPRNVRERRSFEVLLFLHGTTGFTDACAPSSTMDWQGLAAALASLGYIVVGPDYIGLRALEGPTGFPHPYLVGTTTAIASLDALRAGVRHVAAQNTNTCAGARYVTIGGSQGGHAALWVDRIGGYYAPEYELMGTVATVPPADLETETNRALRETVQATANAMAFITVTAPWYGLASRLGEVLREPWVNELPPLLAMSCSPGDRVRDATRESVFTQAMLDAGGSAAGIRSLQPWGCLVTENGLTTTTVPRAAPTRASYGIFWVSGENDQLVNTPIERASFETLCGRGYPMQYLECAGASHTATTGWALPEILEFARARFDERPLDAATRCRVSAPTRCRATPMGG